MMLKKIVMLIVTTLGLITLSGFLFMFGTKAIHITIADICFRLIPYTWAIIFIWILLPYIKRGINYLVDHRND